MARTKIVLDPDRILGGKAGLLARETRAQAAKVQGKPRADRGTAAKVQDKPRADRATGAKVLVKVTAPATKG